MKKSPRPRWKRFTPRVFFRECIHCGYRYKGVEMFKGTDILRHIICAKCYASKLHKRTTDP